MCVWGGVMFTCIHHSNDAQLPGWADFNGICYTMDEWSHCYLARNSFYFLSSRQVEWLRGDPRTISSWTSFTSCRSLKGMLFSPQKIPLIIFLCLRAQYAETGRVHAHIHTRAHTHLYTRKHTHTQTLPACCSLVPMPWGGEKGEEWAFSIITC